MNANFDLRPDTAAINKHLYALFPPALVGQFPDSRIEIAYGCPVPDKAMTFPATKIGAITEFVVERNGAGDNIYVGPTLKKPETPPCGRTNSADFLVGWWVFADHDEGAMEARQRAKNAGLDPGILVISGTIPEPREHHYFRVPPTQDNSVRVAAMNGIQGACGGDSVHDAARIMRLAGTISYPSQKKMARGYVPELVTVLAERDPKVHSLEAMVALGGKSLPRTEGPRSDDELTALLQETRVPGRWHAPMLKAIATMVGRGWNDVQIRLACAQYCDEGAEDQDLDAMIEGARERWDVPNSDDTDEGEGQGPSARRPGPRNRHIPNSSG